MDELVGIFRVEYSRWSVSRKWLRSVSSTQPGSISQISAVADKFATKIKYSVAFTIGRINLVLPYVRIFVYKIVHRLLKGQSTTGS